MPDRVWVYETFFNRGEVVEIRAIGGVRGKNKAWEGFAGGQKPVVSGYFDDAEAFKKAALALDAAGAHGVYYTLNPCKPELLSRAANRLKAGVNTTTDQDILCIRWIPIDLDPVRPSGISSSQPELDKAKAVAQTIAAWLEGEMMAPKGFRAFSGNGYHILYRLQDRPNEPVTVDKIRKWLLVLASKFGTEEVQVDTAVFNPARIWKLYGTTARKGDSTEERPHRKSVLYL